MSLHQRSHPEYVEGCGPCKWATISFGTVPGGAKDARIGATHIRRRGKGLESYAARRKAGERPDGTTLEAQEKYDKRMEAFQNIEPTMRESLPSAAVEKVADSVANKPR